MIQTLTKMNDRYNIKWERIIIYVLRVRFDSETNVYYTLSKPCIECVKALRKVNICKVCWSAEGGTFEMCRPRDLTSQHVSRKYRVGVDD